MQLKIATAMHAILQRGRAYLSSRVKSHTEESGLDLGVAEVQKLDPTWG